MEKHSRKKIWDIVFYSSMITILISGIMTACSETDTQKIVHSLSFGILMPTLLTIFYRFSFKYLERKEDILTESKTISVFLMLNGFALAGLPSILSLFKEDKMISWIITGFFLTPLISIVFFIFGYFDKKPTHIQRGIFSLSVFFAIILFFFLAFFIESIRLELIK